MKQKSILFIGNHFISKHSNLNVWNEIPKRLSEFGWEILTTSNKVSKPFRLFDILWTIFTKRHIYQIAQVDVFSGPAFIWAELSVLLLKLLHKPVVITLRGGNLPDFAIIHHSRFERFLKNADAIVSPSAYLKESLNYLNYLIEIIPNPVNMNMYSYKNRKNVRPKIIWVRAFHEIYNPSLVPKVVEILQKKWSNLSLTMVGPDKKDGSLQKMNKIAEEMKVMKKIKLTGGVSRQLVAEYLSQNDIFINTTNFDNMPVSVIEAMASGLCIVSTNVGGIPYLLRTDVDALLVEPNAPVQMANAIERILIEPNLASMLSKNARMKAEQFSWEIILPAWEKILEKLI